MCGIAGIIRERGDTADAAAQVARMIAAIAHRGPNGIRVESLPGLALAHARLSIIDLEGGWQPLHHADDVLIGNGEIYNYLELAAEFDLAAALATGSDFEPLLHLYPRLGAAVFQRLRGMYGLCVRRGQEPAVLARDVFGVKPLYTRQWGEAGQAATLFASEPRAVLAADGAKAKLSV
jgi:asparagine synthase (glutamine-hydrolysing)